MVLCTRIFRNFSYNNIRDEWEREIFRRRVPRAGKRHETFTGTAVAERTTTEIAWKYDDQLRTVIFSLKLKSNSPVLK